MPSWVEGPAQWKPSTWCMCERLATRSEIGWRSGARCMKRIVKEEMFIRKMEEHRIKYGKLHEVTFFWSRWMKMRNVLCNVNLHPMLCKLSFSILQLNHAKELFKGVVCQPVAVSEVGSNHLLVREAASATLPALRARAPRSRPPVSPWHPSPERKFRSTTRRMMPGSSLTETCHLA